MGIFDSLKEKIKRDREFKRKEKEAYLNARRIEDEIDSELKEEEKQERLKEKEKNKGLSKSQIFLDKTIKFIKEMKSNDELEELKTYMSEKELEDMEKQNKEERKFTIKAIAILGVIVIVVTALLLVVGELLKGDLEKVTKPMLEEYYETTFGEKEKMTTLRYLDQDKHIVLATFKSGINLMCVDNEYIGNDSTYESIYADYKKFLLNNISGTNMIMHNPKLSFKPYVVDYNYYIDYIDTLPSNLKFSDMYNTSNLIINDVIIYEGNINKTNILNMANHLGENSAFYLIKMSAFNILNLTIVKKNSIESFDVQEQKNLGNEDIFYLFDQNINKIDEVKITNLSPSYGKTGNKYYTNVKSLKVNTSYLQRMNYEEEDTRANYYLLKFSKDTKYDNVAIIDRNYKPYEVENYPPFITIQSQSGLIVIGEKEMTLANATEDKKPFLCRFNLC